MKDRGVRNSLCDTLVITETFVRAMKLEVTVAAHPWSCLSLQKRNTKWPTMFQSSGKVGLLKVVAPLLLNGFLRGW